MLSDLFELHRARVNLHQAYDAIASTNLAGKPAVLGSIDQADDVLLDLMRKGAKRGLRYLTTGRIRRTRIYEELTEICRQLVAEEMSGQQAAGESPDQSNVKFITAGRNGTGEE